MQPARQPEQPTRVSFIIFTAETALWVALTLAALAGFVAGLLVARSRRR